MNQSFTIYFFRENGQDDDQANTESTLEECKVNGG